MKKIIDVIFPYNFYLHIFQLEHYDNARFLGWLTRNFWKRFSQNKKPLVSTQKTKVIKILSTIWFVGIILIYPLWSIILIIQPWLLIMLALASLKPYELFNRHMTIKKTLHKIKTLPHVQVVAIAGSYGKTSVKDILYHLLKPYYKVLKTPLSYNTIFGIAQVVDLELDTTYNFFLCELGEFQKGDIKEMCEMVLPTHGIITGINDQHLERFKTIEITIATLFELADYLKKIVVNGQNNYITHEIHNRTPSRFTTYSNPSSKLIINRVSFSEKGSHFSLIYKNKVYQVTTPLLGYAHLNNILGAATMALELGLSIEQIVKQISSVPHIPHRYDQTLLDTNLLLIDNSYSSNSDSFRESLKLLEKIPRSTKILVTPGIVELGLTSNSIHQNLGKEANKVCTHVILVGASDRTNALATGINPEKIIWIDDIKKLWETVQTLNAISSDTVVLLENDLPDNY